MTNDNTGAAGARAGRPLPLDWRILVSGYVPQYLYELGMLEDVRPFAEVMAAANIGAVARAADDSVEFWRLIRESRVSK